ncbi:DUF167 domain-containing protein [archaeon]|nr:MAG: DUF167 domain-containing protein [archaeon]
MIISVRTIPNAKKPQILKEEDSYKVKVDAQAQDGKANSRLIEILADHFGVSKSSVSIIKGLKSRNKIVEIKI